MGGVVSSGNTATSGSFRLDIQGLRAIAVLLVIAAHAGFAGFEGGFVGVDIFFVISGFVITSLLMRQPARNLLSNLRNFYVRRILRIVPAATVVLTVTVFASYFILGGFFDETVLDDVRSATLFSANFHLINVSADYFMSGAQASLVTHFWSLAVEEQFYFIYPLIVFSLTYLSNETNRIKVLRNFLAAAVIASALWSWHLTPLNQVLAYYSPLTRFWELALGGFVATLPWIPFKHKATLAISWIAVIGLITSVAKLNATVPFPGIAAWGPCGFTALLIYFSSKPPAGSPAGYLQAKPLTYIGDISYSLYLWHFIWLMLPGQMEFPPEGIWVKPVLILGAFLCAAASYHLMENRIRHSKKFVRDGFATGLLLAVCLAISFDSTLIVENLWLSRP
ncbi:MAG: acyltransferase [Actinomycetota bacterium]|jgi:peptidoglycan/LPS O-acetylase OafA/YrhL